MTIAIIQARMGSTRLPGKVLKIVEGLPDRRAGKTLLEHLILRVLRAKTLDKIVVATTENPEDEAVASEAAKLGVDVFCGSEEDVLDRYYQAAKKYGADIVVRLTGDCPLMDPAIIDEVVGFYQKNKDKYDYVSNVRPPTYPDGMDVEVFSFAVLEKAWKEAKLTSEREHVTAYIGNHPEIFKIGNIEYKKDVSNIRLTVDNPEDLILVEKIFIALNKKNGNFGLEDILDVLDKNPEIAKINQTIKRNEGYEKSLKNDKNGNLIK
ncbi:MAG: glycosyltransferase family protein [Candidatus Azambacteria bacterium]|nr:glycosyltransferase family protein [Candidatus Azambacteria bacterium]